MSRRLALPLLALLIGLHLVLALGRIDAVGITTDEAAHLTAGVTYWQHNDYRLQPENGNLPQRWAALGALRHDPTFHPQTAPRLWEYSDVWVLADVFFFRSGNPILAMLFDARALMSLWAAGLCGLVYAWSAQLWGRAAGLFSAAMLAVSPTLLANGPLVTSDTVGALTLLGATGAIWQALRRGGARWIALSLVATSLAFVAKFSCVLLLPIAAVLAGIDLARRPAAERAHRLRRTLALVAAHAVAIWGTIWLCFGFRFGGGSPDLPPLQQYYLPWEVILSREGLLTTLIQFARDHHLFPEAYLEGFAFVRHYAAERSAFLFGETSTTGWWWFFPATYLLKSTEAELLLTVAALAAGLRVLAKAPARHAERWGQLTPLLVFGAVYGGSAVLGSLNIGHRHILPLYPVLFILAGALVPRTVGRWRPAWALLPLGSLAAALSVAPHYLTYFNAPTGGPQTAWRKLVDSSLDWGQGLPALADWLEEHRAPGERVFLTYYGSDDAAFRGIEATSWASVYDHHRTQTFARLEPGLYCMGASMLQMVYSPMRGPWSAPREAHYTRLHQTLLAQVESGAHPGTTNDLDSSDPDSLWMFDQLRFSRMAQYLRVRGPDAVVANSMLVFRLNEEEVRTCTDGSIMALSQLIERAAAR